MAGKELSVDDLVNLWQQGWLERYFAAAGIDLSAQLVVSSGRERTLNAQGGVTIGPVSISATYAETFRQATTTNLSVSIQLQRQSRSDALTEAFGALVTPKASALPAGPPRP